MESQYYRTFIGLPLRVEPSLLEARKRLIGALSRERISWTDPDQYHITLRFLGDTMISAIEEIGNVLHARVGAHLQENLEIRRLGSFGPRKAPRVIWLGFRKCRFIDTLKQEVDQALEKCGLPPAEQKFNAHLTLGRVRHLQNLPEYYRTLDRMDRQFTGTVLSDRLVFFRSILGAKGPEYRALDEIPFRNKINLSESQSTHHPS
jgi:2'-5' RNA ligase